MLESVQALLCKSIDFAGVYPPALQTLEQAVETYRVHAEGSNAWMMARFVCPPDRLSLMAAMADFEAPLSIVVPAGDTLEAFTHHVDETLALVDRYAEPARIEAFELRWPSEANRPDGSFGLAVRRVAERVANAGYEGCRLYFELPSPAQFEACFDALADYGHNPHCRRFPAGLKLRTGGAVASAYPTPAEVAAVIVASTKRNISWKATAGLHHPICHGEPTLHVHCHGFLNVFVADVFCQVYGFDAGRVQEILEERNPQEFRFTNGMIAWREWAVAVEQIHRARSRGLRSFGSCSFDEPVDGLRNLGLL